MSIIAIATSFIPELLRVPPVSKRGSGHRQARMRGRIYGEFKTAVQKEFPGLTEEQVQEYWKQTRELAELERFAD